MKLPFIPEQTLVVRPGIRRGESDWRRFQDRGPAWLVATARASACFAVTVLPLFLTVSAYLVLGLRAGAAAAAVVAFGWLYLLALRATRQERRTRPMVTLREVA